MASSFEMLASAAIKPIAATHLLWAGLSIGVVLEPAQYLFLIVFLGFIAVLGHFARFIGSFVVGGVFALGLFAVDAERALAMVLIVEAASLSSVAVVGALSLWTQCVALSELRAASMRGRSKTFTSRPGAWRRSAGCAIAPGDGNNDCRWGDPMAAPRYGARASVPRHGLNHRDQVDAAQ